MNASFLSLATEQFKASAAQAAQTLVTIGANLDEMAASDEYVQSEGYNKNTTHTKKHNHTTTTMNSNTVEASSHFAPPPSSSNQRRSAAMASAVVTAPYMPGQQRHDSSMVRKVNDDDASTISSHSSAPLSFYKRSERGTATASVSVTAEQHADVVPLKVHVPNAKFATTKSGRGHSASLLLNKRPDDGSSSEEDVEENDPILAYSRQTRNESHKVNRFMDDLETRMNTPAQQQQSLPVVPQSHTVSSPAPETTSWLSSTFRSVAASGVSSPQSTTNRPPPLARIKRHTTTPNIEETIVRSNAATLLDETEWRELEQLRTTTTKEPLTNTSTTLAMALNFPVVQRHRREFFVALTLVLSVVVYYLYTNSMSIGLV